LQEGEISLSVYLGAQSHILGAPGDGQSGRNMLLNEHWNKQLLCLIGFTVIVIIIIQNTTEMDHLRILILNAIYRQKL
jgi:hypothetical protein